MTEDEFKNLMRRAEPFYDINSGIGFNVEVSDPMKGQTPYPTATKLTQG